MTYTFLEFLVVGESVSRLSVRPWLTVDGQTDRPSGPSTVHAMHDAPRLESDGESDGEFDWGGTPANVTGEQSLTGSLMGSLTGAVHPQMSPGNRV